MVVVGSRHVGARVAGRRHGVAPKVSVPAGDCTTSHTGKVACVENGVCSTKCPVCVCRMCIPTKQVEGGGMCVWAGGACPGVSPETTAMVASPTVCSGSRW